MEQQTDEITETEIMADKEREVIEEVAQGDQIDKAGVREGLHLSLIHISILILLNQSRQLWESKHAYQR